MAVERDGDDVVVRVAGHLVGIPHVVIVHVGPELVAGLILVRLPLDVRGDVGQPASALKRVAPGEEDVRAGSGVDQNGLLLDLGRGISGLEVVEVLDGHVRIHGQVRVADVTGGVKDRGVLLGGLLVDGRVRALQMDLQLDIAFRHLMRLEVTGVNDVVAALRARAAAGDQSQEHRNRQK